MCSGGSGGGGGDPYALRGGATPAAWVRLVGAGVEDDVVGSGRGAGTGGCGHFLEACFLCRKPLAGNRDIYMYRGDTPFCSEECRREQIEMDEEMERKQKSTPNKVTLRAPSPREVEAPPKPHKVRAGSILAG